MNYEKTKFLPEDVYSFLGQIVGVRSNANYILEYLRSMYGRFYLGLADQFCIQSYLGVDRPRHTIQIIDNLEDSNELLFDDTYHLYRFSKSGTYSRLSYQNLHAPADPHSYFLEFYDHLTLIASALLRTISILAKDFLLIHAGAVSLNDQGIIFPASTEMGKTTLVLKLVMLGFGFLSDEIACISTDLRVLEPFPRKVNIREPSQELLGLSLAKGNMPYPFVSEAWEWSLDIEEITSARISSTCKPHYMVFLRGFGDRPRLDKIASSNALFELLEYTVGPIDDPPSYLFRLAGLLNDIECYSLVIGDLNETAGLM
ncbi:hypothetical protein KA005_21255, partial [bacterium]|nr:hypothetical protein [bacterium]